MPVEPENNPEHERALARLRIRLAQVNNRINETSRDIEILLEKQARFTEPVFADQIEEKQKLLQELTSERDELQKRIDELS